MAVFTEDEVASLTEYQRCGYLHQFTCPNGHDLVPTTEGWMCQHCDYTQNWAHPWMLDWTWKKAAGQIVGWLNGGNEKT